MVNFQATTFNGFYNVLRHIVVTCDQVHFCLHTHARETDRILDTFLVVDRVFLRDHMQHTVLVANTHGFRRVDNVLNVFLRHLFFRNRHHTDFILAADVLTRQGQIDRGNLAICHQFSLVDGALNAFHHRLKVVYPTFIHTTGGAAAHANDIDHTVGQNFPYQSGNLRGANLQSYYQFSVRRLDHCCSACTCA
ncbi:Uncharacterised protein [Enterobacter cloacae]|nr:Uncharacterised protein [Enterobacter cloacae]